MRLNPFSRKEPSEEEQLRKELKKALTRNKEAAKHAEHNLVDLLKKTSMAASTTVRE